MPTKRHKNAIARIRLDAHRLTKREREKLGLPPEPIRRADEPPPFPSDPSGYAWFALTTLPRKEAEAARKLARAGFAAFNPTEMVLARQCRKLKHRRKQRERAMLTSIVLAGFKGRRETRHIPAKVVKDDAGNDRIIPACERVMIVAAVPWIDVLDTDVVTGVVGVGGVPRQVPLGNVIALRMMDGRRASTRNWTPTVEDTVEIAHGPFAGRQGQIRELADGRARVMLFGEGVFAGHVEPLDVAESWLRLPEVVNGS